MPFSEVKVAILSSFVVLSECCTVFSVKLGVCSILPSPIGILEVELSLGVYKYKVIPLPLPPAPPDPPPVPAGPCGPCRPCKPCGPCRPCGP